jgi:hypothetical protein
MVLQPIPSTDSVIKTGNEIYKPIKGDGRTTIPLYKESTSGGYKFMLLNVNEGKNRIRKLLNAAYER